MNERERIAAYWQACETDGRRPKMVYAVVWRGVSECQPAGEIVTWSLTRGAMTSYAKTCGLRLCRVVKMALA